MSHVAHEIMGYLSTVALLMYLGSFGRYLINEARVSRERRLRMESNRAMAQSLMREGQRMIEAFRRERDISEAIGRRLHGQLSA